MPIARVRAVVVDHNGGALTTRCVESLRATTWPGALEIVVVDNASTVPLSDKQWSDEGIGVVRSDTNRGFAGGVNLGMGDLSTTDAVALVNNDAVVEPGWLEPLVKALDADQTLGSASPKIRFTGTYTTIEIRSAVARRQRLDRRLLGVRLHDVRAPRTSYELVDGFWGPQADDRGRAYEWTNGCGRVHVRVDDAASPQVELLLSAPSATPVAVGERGNEIDIVVDSEPRWFSVPLAAARFQLVNNVGTVLNEDWYGADRGYLEPDRGQFDHADELELWSGGAVLLRSHYLQSVGTFDDRLYLYYEDVELALRGRRAGWRYVLVPESVVDHDHSATAVSGSDLAEFYKERNRLLVMAAYASRRTFVVQVIRFKLATLSYAWRDIVVAVANGRRPWLGIVRRRLRSFVSFLRMCRSYVGAPRHL
jgi:GT2 family glycosyltransferase